LWGGKSLPEKLTTTEFKIIYELAKRPGVVKERAYLMNIAYKQENDIEDRTIVALKKSKGGVLLKSQKKAAGLSSNSPIYKSSSGGLSRVSRARLFFAN
jgi:hypothetical protein